MATAIEKKDELKGFAHLITDQFNVHESSKEIRTARVRHNTNAVLTLGEFGLMQLIKGLPSWFMENTPEDPMEKRCLDLVITIAQCAEGKLHIRRDDVILLKGWLEARMTRCEEVRDNELAAIEKGDDKVEFRFNQDTYISMKLMLLEMREWLLGEIIEEEPEDDREPEDPTYE